MSNLVMIGTVPHEPLRLMGEAAKKAGSAATRLSRGDKFVEAGQGVAEQSAGRNITTSKNKIDVAISNNKRAINVMQVGGSIIEQASEIVNRAAKLARFASGNQVSDVDRKGYQTEFKGLMGQMESLGNFEYNGIKLFDGSRSGNTTISSNSGNNSVIYDLSSTSDFVSKGVSLNKNGVIAEASNFGITSAIGETHAEASVDIRGLKEVGSKLTVDNVVIEIVDANVVANNNGNNIQINAGFTASETFANILTALNGSDHETLSQFSYALEDKAVANLGSISNSSAATTFDATDKSMLKITANTTGSKFNDTWIAVANSKAIGSENAVEWTKFHSGYDKNTSGVSYAFEVDLSDKTANVSSNESFKINLGNGKEYEYIFVKNNDDAHKLAADKIAVQIGATLNESMINFASTVSGDTGDHLTTAEYIEKGNTGSLILTASLHSKYDTSYALDKDAYQFINNSTVKLSSYNGQTAVAGSSVAGGASKVLNGVSVGAGAGESNIMGFVSTKTVADLGTKTLTVYSGSTPTNDKALEINFDNSKAFAESGNVHTAATTTVDAYNTVTMGTSDLTDKAAFLEKLTNVLNKYEATGNAVFVLNDAKDGIFLFDVSGATTTEFWVNGVEDTGTNIFTGIGGTINSGLVTTKSGIAGEATQVNIGTEQFDVVTIETGVTANTTANMKADEKNGMRVYLADQNNNYVSVDVDFGDTSVSGSPSATEIAAAALADTGITATGVDLTKLKEYMANNAAKVGGNATDLLDTMNLDDLQFETLAYSAVTGTKKFIGTNVNNSDIAKIVDVEASNSANQDTNIVGTYINSIVAKPVKFIDVNYNTSAASETTDANGKLLGNKATVTVDFSEIANKIAAREAEMAANPAAGLKSIVFDINEIEIAGRNLQIGRRFDDATGNVSETDGTAFTLEDRIQAFKDAITADNYTNWITSNGGSQATSSVNNFEKFTLKEVAENKFEITVHNVAIGDDDTSDLNSIVAVKMTAADGGAATAPTASSAGIYNNTASEGFTKTDLYVSVDKIESSRVYSLNDFLNSEQFSHIVFDPLKTEQTTFSQKLNGNFVNTDISLKAGINGERNSAKFTVILDNGNEYESNDVYLSGNGGVGSNGYKVAGGTEITLSRVGGDKNEVGLSFVVQDSGLDFNQNASNINDMNTNINTMTKSFTSALVDGNVGIQVVAPAKFVKDVGIQSLDQFTFSGNYDNQSHLTGDLKLQSKAGLTAAQGYIQINNLKTGDILNINGKKVTIGTDVMTNTGNMRDALLKYLFESKDSNLSKANYTGIGSDKIVVSSREKGIAGNAIFMSVENINSSGSVTINNEEFTAAKANLNTTRYLGDAHDVLYVKSGTESSSLDMQYLPSDMIGGISDISGKFISGNSQIIDGVHNANSIDISITIGGQKLNGNVALNGGSVASGSAIGAGYLGVGNIVSKDTVLELTDSNKSFSLSITLGDDLLLDGSTAADNQVKLDKYLGEMLAGTKGLSVYQERSISGFNASKVVGTALSALTPQSVTYNSDKYDSDGNAGGLNRFEYDNANKTLSAKIDGSVHKVVLNDSMAAKGFGEHFDSTANKIVGGKGAIMKLHDENSSSYLALNLESISSIDLSSTLAIDMFLKVLNDAFSSNSSGGIKYQVGAHDSLSAYLPNLSMDALLGVNWNSINVSDVASAIDSFNKINDVVDKTNIYQTQVSSDLSAMSRALENNLTSYEAMSEAYDDLIKMPFYESSALYAAAEMTTKAAASALQKINQLSGRIFDSLNQ